MPHIGQQFGREFGRQLESDQPLAILYVEDNFADIMLMESFLQATISDRFTLITLQRLQEVKRALYQHHFDLILLDLGLPDANGLDSLTTILTSFSNQAVVVLTGLDDAATGLQAIQAGAQDYLIKGNYTSKDVMRVIQYAVERNRNAQKLVQMAQYDSLTGLANRASFNDYLNLTLSMAARKSNNVALLFIDLDKFKNINDTYGHDTGDEFTAVVECLSPGIETPLAVAQKLVASLATPIILTNAPPIQASCSIGIALWDAERNALGNCDNNERVTPKILTQFADTAMYEAKQQEGPSFRFYDDAMEKQAHQRVDLLQALHEGRENNEFMVYYQPIFSAANCHLVAIESLLRWDSPQRGLVNPNAFLHLLDEIQLSYDVTNWLMKQSCQQFQQWLSEGILATDSWVSISISPKQFLHPSLIENISESLTSNNMAAIHLRLELTESILQHKGEASLLQLHKLKAMGVGIALNDFGTGFSSIRHIKTSAIDTIIIDRSYVQNYFRSNEEKTCTQAMIQLGQALDKKVIAEGVETKEIANAMIDLGCDYLQGFYLGQPMTAQQLTDEHSCPPKAISQVH